MHTKPCIGTLNDKLNIYACILRGKCKSVTFESPKPIIYCLPNMSLFIKFAKMSLFLTTRLMLLPELLLMALLKKKFQ